VDSRMGNGATPRISRRERLREQLVQDAKAAAREITASEGHGVAATRCAVN
jgi:hypothetical protein